MKVEILAAAEADLAGAVSYYNEQSEGLGYEFAAEVKQTIGRVLLIPGCMASSFSVHPAVPHQAVPVRRRVPGTWRSDLGGGGHALAQASGFLETACWTGAMLEGRAGLTQPCTRKKRGPGLPLQSSP